MLRYLYPLIMLVLVMLFCRCTPLSFPADSALGPLLTFFGAVGVTIVWPFFIGNRLHEPSWRKLARQLRLAYKPYGTGEGKYKPARIEGLYRGRDLRFASRRIVKSWKGWSRGPLVECYILLKLRTNAPPYFKMEIRDKPRFGITPHLEEVPKTGDAQFDQRLTLYVRPDSLVEDLTKTGLTDQLRHIVRPGRPTTIRLHEGELLFEEKANLFMGAESNLNRLKQIVDVMCNLTDAIEQGRQPNPSPPNFPLGKNIITDEDIKTVADLEYYYPLPVGFEYQLENEIPVIVRLEDGATFSFLIEANMLTFDEPFVRPDGRTGSKTTEIIKRELADASEQGDRLDFSGQGHRFEDKKQGIRNQKIKTTIIGLITSIIVGLIGMASGVIAWFPGYIVTFPFGTPVPSAGILFFIVASMIGGLLGGITGTLFCAKLGKSRFNQPFDGRGAILFGFGGIIFGVICAVIVGAIPGFFFSPTGQ